MSEIAVRTEKIGKLYPLVRTLRQDTLRDILARAFTAPARWLSNGTSVGPANDASLPASMVKGGDSGYFWALRNVEFEIKRGEVIGIIGRNGAGKSTLLKILSRITEPTEGEATIYGRVGSLLEVGTGFHPELTGRENVYLNGAILGMTKKEIDRDFDEIIAFAEIETFIDMPVKRYSSGMYMRLAFSVAAHLNPEILIVDEVLAVGDASFQRKCLGKIGEVAREGRTVLFVSHNMAAVEHLCDRVLLLRDGRIIADGSPSQAIAEYLGTFAPTSQEDRLDAVKRSPGLLPVIRQLEFLDHAGRRANTVRVGGPVTIRISYEHSQPIKRPYFGLSFETTAGVKVFWVQSRLQGHELPDLPAIGTVVCRIPRLPLVPGLYFVQPGCGTGTTQLDLLPRACQLQVTEADVFGTGRLPNSTQGLVIVDAVWEPAAPEGFQI